MLLGMADTGFAMSPSSTHFQLGYLPLTRIIPLYRFAFKEKEKVQ